MCRQRKDSERTAHGQRKDSERTAKGQRKDTTNNINNINNINKEKEIYKEKEKRKSVTKDTSNLQVLPDNNNKIKLNMSKQITKNPENGNTPNNLESFRPSENTNPSSLQTNNGNPSESSHCFCDSVSGCDSPNNLQIQASVRDNTKNGGNPNKAEMNNPERLAFWQEQYNRYVKLANKSLSRANAQFFGIDPNATPQSKQKYYATLRGFIIAQLTKQLKEENNL